MKNEHFIPISIHTLIKNLNLAPHSELSQIFKLIIAWYQYDFNQTFNHIKNHYQLFNPDLDIIIDTNREKEKEQHLLLEKATHLLQKANYTQLSIAEIENAINTQPYSGLNIKVNTEDYEIFDIYYRGNTTTEITPQSILNYIRTPTPQTICIYKRLFIIAKLKDFNKRVVELTHEHNISTAKAQKKLRKIYQKLPKNVTSEFIFFKLFKDIPHLDLEMLFFVQQINLKLFDKIKLLISGGISTGAGVFATLGKLATALNPIAMLGAIGGLIGVVIKQIRNLLNQHNKYQNTLTTSLYFQSLNNNLGAINFIGNSASEEEIKEVILGYYFKLQHPTASHKELDTIIEDYLHQTYNIAIDFEIDDSIQKMRKLGLIQHNKIVSTSQALQLLNQQWDNVFI
jgi:hypothetical protein